MFFSLHWVILFIIVDEYGALARSSEFTKTCHNTNIIVHTTGEDASYINGKSESPNNTLANITRSLLLKSRHNIQPWCFAYHYDIWLSFQTENILRADVPYLLWHVTRPSHKHIKICGVRVYAINGLATRKKLDDRSHWDYFMGYAATKVVNLYWNPYQLCLFTETNIFGLIIIILVSP